MTIRMRAGATPSRRKFLSSACATATMTVIDGVARPYLSFRRIGRASHTDCNRATSRSIPAWCGRGPTGRPACWSRSRPRRASGTSATRLRRCAAGKRFHRQGAAGRTAGRAGHLLSHPVPEPVVAGDCRRAAGRPVPHRAGDRKNGVFVWSGDTAGGGWGIDLARGGMRTYATMLANRPDFFIHCGDGIYADCPIRREQKLRTEKYGGTSSPRRNPRSPRRSPSSAATTNTICSTPTCAHSTPKCRSSRNGTITRSPTTGARRQHAQRATAIARRACSSSWRAGAAPSTNSCRCGRRQAEAGRIYRKIPTVRCSTCSCSTCARIAAPTTATSRAKARTPSARPEATRLAQARTRALARDLEGDRRGSAARRVQP